MPGTCPAMTAEQRSWRQILLQLSPHPANNGALPRFLALYVTLFASFGVVSPFLGAFLAERGLRPETIGLVLAAGTAVRLFAGPLGGHLADRLGAPRWVLTGYVTASAV